MDTVPQAPRILITGGGRGVGAATARLAAARGYEIAITFVSDESAALTVAAEVEAVGRRALPVRADSADREQVTHAYDVLFASWILTGRLQLRDAPCITTYFSDPSGAADELECDLAIPIR